MKNYENIEEYIASYPENVRLLLHELRQIIKEVVPPETGEKMSYGIPTFTYHGNLVHFGGFKDHVSFFPGGIVPQFADELGAYKTSKGTIQFPLDKPLPKDLIQIITKAAIKRNLERTRT